MAKFFKIILNLPEIPTEKQVVCDVIFQIFYSLIHGNANLTPFTIGLTRMIHDTCRL